MEPHRTLQTVLADYQQRKANHEQHLSRIQQRIYRIGTIRLLLFVAAIAGAIYFRHEGWTVVVPVIVVCLVPFLILMKVHDRLFYDKDYTQQLIDINANELAALDYRTDCFDGGKDFQDPAHPYSTTWTCLATAPCSNTSTVRRPTSDGSGLPDGSPVRSTARQTSSCVRMPCAN